MERVVDSGSCCSSERAVDSDTSRFAVHAAGDFRTWRAVDTGTFCSAAHKAGGDGGWWGVGGSSDERNRVTREKFAS